MALPHRPLGKTGVQLPIIGYGTAPLGKIKVMDGAFSALEAARRQGMTRRVGITGHARPWALVEKDKPSDSSPIFWVYDSKVMAWKEDSEPELVTY